MTEHATMPSPPPRITLADRTIIVTGSGHGLGRSYALELAARGANVVVNDLDLAAAEDTVAAIVAQGGQAILCHQDVADYNAAGCIVADALDRFGAVHGLIANAGILKDKSFANMSIEDFNLVLQVHLMGTVHVLHHAWPHMCKQNHGRVIFTSSSSGLWGNFGQSNYDAAKFGIVGLMHALKLEGARYNIRVNTIAPYAASRLGKGFFPEALEQEMVAEHVSALVVYLCADQCNLNGEIVELGAGRMTRAKLFRTDGITFKTTPSPENLMEKLPDLLRQPFDQSFDSALESFEDHMKHQDF